MISIIVPVLNEAAVIDPFLAHLEGLAGRYEVIVVDGGSDDETVQLARRRVQVLASPRGRAVQMNRGAEAARGEAFLFVHADSRLHPQAVPTLEQALTDPAIVGGCFSLALDDPALIYRLIAFFSNLRSGVLGHMLGDQGIFVRREVFERLGGYAEIELMEDCEFSDRLNRAGPIVQLKLPIVTSARRWQRCGIWRTIFLMQRLRWLYRLGLSPAKLKQYYVDAR